MKNQLQKPIPAEYMLVAVKECETDPIISAMKLQITTLEDLIPCNNQNTELLQLNIDTCQFLLKSCEEMPVAWVLGQSEPYFLRIHIYEIECFLASLQAYRETQYTAGNLREVKSLTPVINRIKALQTRNSVLVSKFNTLVTQEKRSIMEMVWKMPR